MPSSLNLQVPSGNMSASDRLMWLRILTAAKLATSLELPTTPDAMQLDAKSWPILLLSLSHALDTGTGWSTDHSSGSSLRSIVDWLSNLVSRVFQDTLLQLTKLPPLRKAHPSSEGKTNGIYFFVEYAACTSCLNLVLMPLRQLLLPLNRNHADSYSSSTIFKLLGLAYECPVLLFDAISVASGRPNGDYYAGEDPMHMHLCTCTYAHAPMHMHLCTLCKCYTGEGGIDQSLLETLGLVTTSFFSSARPEETMIIFSDSYMPMEYNSDLTQHGWKPSPSTMTVPKHQMTHWYAVLAR